MKFVLMLFIFRLDQVKGIPGEGMPLRRNPFDKGNLYIKFKVVFPPNHFTTEEKLKVGIIVVYLYALIYYFIYSNL